jgi:hypothetical protein
MDVAKLLSQIVEFENNKILPTLEWIYVFKRYTYSSSDVNHIFSFI